jgi:tetratricopeptide (TPR) repeat protein
LAALMYLKRNEVTRAKAEVETLREAQAKRRNDRQLELRLWEAQGRLLCQTGAADEGLKLLQRAVDKTKNDFGHHAWGNGAYYMEVWGECALAAWRPEVAEEAFLESLAHDPGSVKAALGMQVLCERQGRTTEAAHFGALARRAWRRAEVRSFDALRDQYEHGLPAAAQTRPADTTRTGGGGS